MHYRNGPRHSFSAVCCCCAVMVVLPGPKKYIATGLAALLVACEPLWVVMLNWGLTRRRPNAKVLLGVLIGLAGVALLVSDEFMSAGSDTELVSAGVLLLAAFSWAAGSVYANHRPIKASTLMASGIQMLGGGLVLLLLAFGAGDVNRLNIASASWLSLGAVCYLIVFGSLVGFTAYSWLLRNVTPARAATYAYVNPVVAVLLGWFLADETLTSRMLIAAVIIVGSVVLITTFGAEHTASTAPDVHDSDCPTHPSALRRQPRGLHNFQGLCYYGAPIVFAGNFDNPQLFRRVAQG